ncbi:MAG: flagellar hook-associated protein 2, partial [Deltaproteobacteria bacterium]|nr:flagellar hook-associated protein 2 [Deltaproteobacteria bacterium]
MSSITFTGLASGLDTDTIVSGLMGVEREPLTRLEMDKEYHELRLATYHEFHEKLAALDTVVEGLYLTSQIRQSRVTLSGEAVVSASVTSAPEGSYTVTVEQLAQVQKSVSHSDY